MATPAQTKTRVEEVHIVWITAGLGCDGDSVSITAASQPSIEDVLLGAIPGLPKVHLHNPVLAYELGGESFMTWWYRAERGELDPFVLVVEGSIPNEKIKSEGYWAALGTDATTGQPIPTSDWIDRLAPKALAVVAAGTCATYGGIHAMAGNPTGAMGLPDYLGWNWHSKAGIPIVCVPGVPGAARQLHGDADLPALPSSGHGAHDPARRRAAAHLALRPNRT
jgi:hydrogenase small subunit